MILSPSSFEKTEKVGLWMLTARIRIVADCVALSCQVTEKLKRATTLEFTTVSAIIFIHRCSQLFIVAIKL